MSFEDQPEINHPATEVSSPSDADATKPLASGAADELLVGLIAYRDGRLGPDLLIDAVGAWMADRSRSMTTILNGLGVVVNLSPGTQATLAREPSTEVQARDEPEPESRRPSTRFRTDDRQGCRYQILHHHARGGLGEIYLAEDLELGRKVALKEIQTRHLQNQQHHARFLLEAEVTGNLEHPGIVPVHGLGKYADGRPFYAMRFIKGETLKEAISRFHHHDPEHADPRPGLRKLLRRFLDVCDAIEYAHSRGVIHRDIKPANIMLGKFGETLVVDWGLAKLIQRPEPDGEILSEPEDGSFHPGSLSSLEPTRMDSVYGTPQFMSPEQAAGQIDRIGPASDVYGLGATLYNLITGRTAFPDEPMITLRRKIIQGEFARPTEVASQVSRPLEAICLKAMALEPEARYQSAKALGQDIERWLDDLPVLAYPDPLLDRIGRWSRVHRSLVSSASALVLTALVGLTVLALTLRAERNNTQIQFQRAEQALIVSNFERNQAQQARERVLDTLKITGEAIAKIVVGVADDQLAQSPQMELVRSRLSDEALGMARKITDRWPDDPLVAVLAAPIFHRAANIQRLIGQSDRSIENYHRAMKLYENAIPADPRRSVQLRLFWAMVGVDHAEGLRMAGRMPDSIRASGQVLEGIKACSPDDPSVQQTLARTHFNQAELLIATGRLEEARVSEDLAIVLLDRVMVRRPKDEESRLKKTFPLRGRAVIARESGHSQDAEAGFAAALANLDAVGEPFRGGNNVEFLRATILNDRGWMLARDSSRWLEAERSHAEARAIMDRLTNDFPMIPVYRLELAVAQLGRASALAREDSQRSEAITEALGARWTLESLLADCSWTPEALGYLGQTLGLLGRLSTDRVQAREYLEEAVNKQGKALLENPESPRDQAALRQHRENLGPLSHEE